MGQGASERHFILSLEHRGPFTTQRIRVREAWSLAPGNRITDNPVGRLFVPIVLKYLTTQADDPCKPDRRHLAPNLLDFNHLELASEEKGLEYSRSTTPKIRG